MFIVPISQMPSVSSLRETTQAVQNPASGVSLPFAEVFKDAFDNLAEKQEIAEQDAYNLAFGKTDDLHTVMINSEIAATALELTVQLTSRALNAYNEIMRMQV